MFQTSVDLLFFYHDYSNIIYEFFFNCFINLTTISLGNMRRHNIWIFNYRFRKQAKKREKIKHHLWGSWINIIYWFFLLRSSHFLFFFYNRVILKWRYVSLQCILLFLPLKIIFQNILFFTTNTFYLKLKIDTVLNFARFYKIVNLFTLNSFNRRL